MKMSSMTSYPLCCSLVVTPEPFALSAKVKPSITIESASAVHMSAAPAVPRFMVMTVSPDPPGVRVRASTPALAPVNRSPALRITNGPVITYLPAATSMVSPAAASP